jgi:hypothetical protein
MRIEKDKEPRRPKSRFPTWLLVLLIAIVLAVAAVGTVTLVRRENPPVQQFGFRFF